MKKPLNALIVEDSADDAKLLIRVLTRGGYEVQAKRVETAEELSAALENARWDVVLSDYSLPNFSGEAALRMIRESGRDLPFIFVSGMMGEEIAVAAMKAGAHDYVMKNNPARLVPAIERELRDAIERHQHRIAEKQMRMSEHKYRHLFRSMSDAALLIAEGSGRLIDANEQAEVVFGRTRDELLGLTSDDLYSQTGDQPWPEPPAPGGLQGSAEGESVVRRLNGSVVPVHVCVSRVELYDRPFRLALFRDISQRKRAEAALRAVLRHARTIVMDAIVTAPDDWSRDATDWSVADFGWELHFQDVEAAQAVLPLEVPPGKHYRDFWDTARLLEDRTAMAGVATRAFATGAASWQQEFRSRDRYGRVHTFMQAALIEPLGPTQWRVTTVNTDISDRVAAEEALRTSEERLATIFNLSPTAICIVRASDGRFVEINHAFETGTGYSRTEIIGHTSDELNLWSDLDERAAIVREVEAKGTAVAFKLKGRRKGGEVGVGLSSVTRIMLNDEAHLLWLIQDITELDRAEEARRETDRRFRQLAESIDEVFWLTDTSKRQMIYVSPAYARIWGRSCESVYEKPMSWLDAVRIEDREQVRSALPQQVSGAYDLEYRIVRPDGSVRWIHERAFPVRDEHGQIYRIAGVASDITVSRDLEEQIRQSQKMDAVGQLAGGIAHDFNNLLTVIQLQASMLVEHTLPDGETALGVREIMEAAKRASNLTRQLLTFSRRQTRSARDLDLAEVLGGIAKLLRRVLGEDIALESHFAPNLPQVHADPGMMEQVLMNLVINARDAMPTGGRLVISLDTVELDATDVLEHARVNAGRFLRLQVSDTGCGIAPEIRDRIFEPFFTTKEVGKGTGLGLATVFGIVKQHRGWIDVESEVGRGSTFRVFFPALAQSAASAPASVEKAYARGGSESILLVEDEPLVRAVASTALRQRGYRVYEASRASEALKCWDEAQGKIDLLLTDLIMPGGVTGKELAEKLLERAPHLRTIYTTGQSTSTVGQQLKLEPGINYLAKPYSFTELAEIVRRRLDAPARPARL